MQNMTENITRLTESSGAKLLMGAIQVLLMAVVALSLYSYRKDTQDIADLVRAVNDFSINKATSELRLQRVETQANSNTKDIAEVKQLSQQNTFNIDRLQEVIKARTLNGRP